MNKTQLDKMKASDAQKKRLDGILSLYPVGLTEKELTRILGEPVQPSALAAYPRTVRGVQRFGTCGIFEMPEKPSEVPITYLVNESVTVRRPSDKGKWEKKHFAHRNYVVRCAPFSEAVERSLFSGYQFVTGGFYRTPDGKVRAGENLSYIQVLMAEWDNPLEGYQSIEEIAERHPFISENAALVTESVSGFPKGRAFFVLPTFATGEQITAYRDGLVREFTEHGEPIDKGGSRAINGAFGRVGMRHVWRDNFVSGEALKRWAAWAAEKPKRTSDAIPIRDSEKLPDGIEWNDEGFSQYFCKSKFCRLDDSHGVGDAVFFKKRDDGGVVGYCYSCSKGWLEIRPRRRRERAPILKKDTDVVDSDEAELEADVASVRAALKKDVVYFLKRPRGEGKYAQVLLLKQDTGSGKTYGVISSVDTLIHISAHGGLADEAFETASQLENGAERWRSRDYQWLENLEAAKVKNPKSITEDERGRIEDLVFSDGQGMCAYVDVAEKLLSAGHSLGASLCGLCNWMETCKENAYLMQHSADWIRETPQIFIALPELQLAADPIMASWAKRLKTIQADDADERDADEGDADKRVLILDDVCPSRLPPRRVIFDRGIEKLLLSRSESWVGESGNAHFENADSLKFLKRLEIFLKGTGDIEALNEILGAFRSGRIIGELSEIPYYLKISKHKGKTATTCWVSGKTCSVYQLPDTILAEIGEADAEAARKKEDDARKKKGWRLKKRTPDDINEENRKAGEKLILRLRPGWHRFFLEPRTAFASGIFSQKAPIPIVDAAFGWVSALFKKDAVIRRVASEDGRPGLEIVMPAVLNFPKTIALSATANQEEWESILKVPDGEWEGKKVKMAQVEVEVSGGARLPFKENVRVYQVNRAKYTDRSFFDVDASGATVPGERLADAIAIIVKTLEHDLSTVVFGRDSMERLLVDGWEGDGDGIVGVSAAVSAERFARFTFVNYSSMIGLNDLGGKDAAFLFLPSPAPEALMTRCASQYREIFYELDFESRQSGEVRIGNWRMSTTVFSDARVQGVVEQMIYEALYQAAMRLRPMLFSGKLIFLVTAWPVKGLTDRKEVIPVSFSDILNAEDLRSITPELSTDERIAVRLENGDSLKEIAESEGVSERHVYRVKGVDDKTERDAAVRAASKAGKSMRAISKDFCIGFRTVAKILKG